MTILAKGPEPSVGPLSAPSKQAEGLVDVYFSVDVETDGPIPGPYSMLSFAIVQAGTLAGGRFRRPESPESLYLELKPISTDFVPEALEVNGLDRDRLLREGLDPAEAMECASQWISSHVQRGEPILVAYPLSFDWSWLYWYFVRFTGRSPFRHSGCFDVKTAIAVKSRQTISGSSRRSLIPELRSRQPHTHHALDDARAQAEVFANLMEWKGK